MRLLGLLSILAPLVASAQIPIHSSTPATSSTTFVDALSADPDYTHLIRLLQRSRLIPTLARLNGTTLFAPTNDAIERHAAYNSLWDVVLYEDGDYLEPRDNIQEKLRQELFYHMLNGTLPPFPQPEELTVQVHETLHYPRKPIDPPTGNPPPSPPWIPEPGGTLGGRPQRLRLASRSKGVWVGVDALGKGGVEVTKGRVDVANGVLVGIDGVLEPPPSLGTFHTVVNPVYEIKWLFNAQRRSFRSTLPSPTSTASRTSRLIWNWRLSLNSQFFSPSIQHGIHCTRSNGSTSKVNSPRTTY